MLFCFLLNNRFILLIQSGFYMDFFFKKLCEVFVKNVFIYTALFFGEKYFIEVLTKKIIDRYIFSSSKFFTIHTLSFSAFFHLTTLTFFYSLFFNLAYLLF